MIFSIFNVAVDLWNHFSRPAPVRTDDEILQECAEAFESESRNIENEDDDSESKNILNICMKCTGKITELTENHGKIDDKIQFSLESSNNCKIKVNDLVCYLAVKEENSTKFVKILSVLNSFWDYNENDAVKVETNSEDFNIVDRVIVGKVKRREGRFAIIDPNNLKVNLDNVKSNFIPIPGDWVEVYCRVQQEKNVTFGNDIGEVLEIIRVCSVRSKVVEGKISQWSEKEGWGVIDNDIVFNSSVCDIKYNLKLGDSVIVDAIESDQQHWSWRAVSLHVMFSVRSGVKKGRRVTYKDTKNGIVIDDDPNFGDVMLNTVSEMKIKITNTGNKPQYFVDAKHCTNEKNSQIHSVKQEEEMTIIKPNETVYVTFKCEPRFIGRTKELIHFSFAGFNIKREFFLNVCDGFNITEHVKGISNFHKKTVDILEDIRNPKKKKFVPGIRPTKPPPFIKVRAPIYQIPQNLMNVFRAATNNCLRGNEELQFFHKELSFPSVLDMSKYPEWFHTLLYIEEIQNMIRYKMYDMEKTWMTKESEYLRVHIEGLAERRPALLIGDSVRVNNPWGDEKNKLSYEGFIHKVHPDGILLRFSHDFHQKYNGEDVSMSFFFSRASFQKCHFAVDLTHTHLGARVLFPDKLILNTKQILFDSSTFSSDGENNFLLKEISDQENSELDSLKKRNLVWFNKKLNHIQKKAVVNILMGEARPLPYIIFGPPGTGKTMTLIEVILQIVCLLPNSRLLIATPSNSAANLLTDRLIKSGRFNPGSLTRLVSVSHVNSGNLPDHLRPYCATLNVSLENTNHSKYYRASDGLRHECNKSFIGRQRITIGTCVCLGSLVRMGFSAGHFTHLIIDEAGQATEPEIMIPLSLTDKINGQIILAGDPMQLGPVVLSHVAKKLGLSETYMERLLNCFPYQRDFIGHGNENCGYDPRLITKLQYNYRSLQSIINFSSKTFYNSEIVSKITTDDPETKRYVERLSNFFEVDEENYSGMIFHGIRGTNNRRNDDPSWFNPQEASTALMYLCKLYKHNFTADEIAIITPYIQQVRYLRSLIREMGSMDEPKIGTVEELQGQERKIIILSTVRSTDICVNDDAEKYLGFIAQPKRVNVAFTRAQYLLIILGNPHILCLDAMWRDALKHVILNDNYIGCDLPPELIED